MAMNNLNEDILGDEKKNQLISEIMAVQQNKIKPIPISKRGAPVKNQQVDECIIEKEYCKIELSLREIEACAKATTKPIEVFCHGALCVAYSGQCLTSETLGQRSANRGECAQACRMPYKLEVDGRLRDLGERRYIFSPQDLCALDRVPQMIAAGVHSFKIEGRMKTALYVATVARTYRQAIDDYFESEEKINLLT